MSVILDALKSKKKIEEKPGRKTSHLIEEGLFLGKKSMVKPDLISFKKLKILVKPLIILVFIISFSLIGYFSYPKIYSFISDHFSSSSEINIALENENKPKVISDHDGNGNININQNQNNSLNNSNNEVVKINENNNQDLPDQLVVSNSKSVEDELSIENAKTFFKEGKLNESLRVYQKLTSTIPDNYEVYNGIGMIYLKKELYSLAENYFAKALEKNQECAGCFNNLGYLKTRTENFTEAKKYLEKSIEINDQSYEPVFNLAVMYEKSGDYLKAIENYQKLMNAFEDFPEDLKTKITDKINRLSGWK